MTLISSGRKKNNCVYQMKHNEAAIITVFTKTEYFPHFQFSNDSESDERIKETEFILLAGS